MEFVHGMNNILSLYKDLHTCMKQTKPLPILQGNVLATVFVETFPDEDIHYFAFVDIDEIFLDIVGGEVELDIYDLLSDSCKQDVNSYVNLIDIVSFLEVVIEQAEELEFYEICQNCKIVQDKMLTILRQVDDFYTRDCCSIS